MKPFALILSILALPAALVAEETKPAADPLDAVWGEPLRFIDEKGDEKQDTEQAAPSEDRTPSMPVMSYIYRHSELEFGTMVTSFDSDLDIESDLGFYVRYGVQVAPRITVHATYRHYSFDNSEVDGPVSEGLLLRAILGGVGYRVPFTDEFALLAGGGVGVMWWDSTGVGANDDTSLIFSGEAALSVRLHEVLRIKAGVMADVVSTDFHDDSSRGVLNLSALLALEIGM